MAESGAKIVFRGDATHAVKEAGKVGDAVDKIPPKVQKVGASWAEATLKLAAFAAAARLAGQMVSNLASKSAEASKSGGSARVNLATSLAALGSKNIDADVRKAETGTGGATLQEIEGFASALASQQREARAKLSPEDAMLAIKKFTAGGALAFGPGGQDLIDGIGRGQSVEDSARAAYDKRPGLFGLSTNTSSQILEEYSLRERERFDELESRRLRRPAGRQARLGAGQIDQRADDGTASGAIAGLFQDTAVGAGAGLYVGGKQDGAMQATLEEQTRLMRKSLGPTLAPGSDQ